MNVEIKDSKPVTQNGASGHHLEKVHSTSKHTVIYKNYHRIIL